MFKRHERGLIFFRHVSDRFSDHSSHFSNRFSYRLKLFGGNFILQPCRLKICSSLAGSSSAPSQGQESEKHRFWRTPFGTLSRTGAIVGNSQTRLFRTCLFVTSTLRLSFALFCALCSLLPTSFFWRSFAL